MTRTANSFAHIYGGIHRMHGATKWLLLFANEVGRRKDSSKIYCTNFSIPVPFWFKGKIVPLIPSLKVSKEISGPRKILYTLYQILGAVILPLFKLHRADCFIYHAEMGLWASFLGRLRFPKALHIYYCYQPPRELYDLKQGTRERLGVWYFILHPLLFAYKCFDRWLVGRTDLVLVWSSEYENYARQIYGNIKTAKIPAAVNFDFIQNIPEPAEGTARIRQRHDLGDDRILLTVSALNWKKNLDLFVRMIAKLRQWGLPVKGTILGEGPERDRLEDLASRLGIDPHLHITGFVPQEQLPLFYQLADIVYFLEPNAAWTMSTIEAGAAATPVITASGGSMETLVVDGKTGFIIPNISNIDQLAQRSRELLDDEEKRLGMGRQNLDHSRQFSVETSVDRFLKAIDQLVLERISPE